MINGSDKLVPMNYSENGPGRIIKYNKKKTKCYVGKYKITSEKEITIIDVPSITDVVTIIAALEKKYLKNEDVENKNEKIIKSIINRTTDDDKIKVIVTFYKPLIEVIPDFDKFHKWNEIYGNQVDPVEKMLKINSPITPLLNMVELDGSIKYYESAEELFKKWFEVRKSFYIKRVERMLIKNEALLTMYDEKIRFIENKNDLLIDGRKISKKEQIEILEKNNFKRLDDSYIRNTMYIFNNEEVMGYIFDEKVNNKVNYDYLLCLEVRQCNNDHLEKLKEERNKLQKENDDLKNKQWKNFKGDELWLADIRNFVNLWNKKKK